MKLSLKTIILGLVLISVVDSLLMTTLVVASNRLVSRIVEKDAFVSEVKEKALSLSQKTVDLRFEGSLVKWRKVDGELSESWKSVYADEVEGLDEVKELQHSLELLVNKEDYVGAVQVSWDMLAEIEETEIYLEKSLSDIILARNYFSFYFALVLMFTSTFGGYVVAWNWIFSPLSSLQKSAEAISKGNDNAGVDPRVLKFNNEMGDLARAIDKMSKALLEKPHELEEKVKKRTVELEKAKDDLGDTLKSSLEEVRKTGAIVESIADGVFVLDGERRVVLMNRVAEELSGFDREELLGKKYDEKLKFVDELSGVEDRQFVEYVYSSARPGMMGENTVLVTKKGKRLPVADSAAPLLDGRGKVDGCVVVFRDVSKTRALEEMKNEFISIASHHLRTPLTALRWKQTRLSKEEKSGPLNDKQKKLLSDMGISIRRLIVLVNSLLDISRVDSGEVALELEVVEVVSLVQSVIRDLQGGFDERGVELKVELGVSELQAKLDRKALIQMVSSMLTNALMYSDEKGSVFMKLGVSGGSFFVNVEDKGLGVPKPEQERVFERFFRASNVESRDYEGVGLSLYLSKRFVEAMAGEIGFSSEEGKGSTFWIRLPFSRSLDSVEMSSDDGGEK